MKPAICMEMLYPGAAPEEKIRRIAGHGFRHIEFWGHGDKDIDALVRVCAETGVSVVNFSGNRKGDLIDSATHEIIISEIRESVGVARRLGTRTLMVLSNELGEGGKVVHSLNRLHADEKRANLIAGLVSLMREVPRDMTITLEPLNTVLDHAGNFLAGTRQAEEIVGEIGDSRLKILCDFYHMALMGEYPPDTAKKYAHYIGHVHIADYPGRHEPGTGHGPWKETLLALREKSYAGYVGFEFSPAADSDASLEAVSKLWRTTFGEQTLN